MTTENSGSPILYIHVPKTAGNTFMQILKREYGKDGHIRIDRKHGVNSDLLSALQNTPHKIKIIQGHYPFGLHEQLGIYAKYITLLRHPIQYTLSNYNHCKRSSDLKLKSRIDAIGSLENFAQTEWAYNIQTQFISGVSHPSILFEANLQDQKMLFERAKSNLEKFMAVGIVERFNESMLSFSNTFSWKKIPVYSKKNVAHRHQPMTLDKKTREIIKEQNNWDLQLYEEANKKLDSQIQQIEEFETKLNYYQTRIKRFQYINKINQPLHRILRKLNISIH